MAEELEEIEVEISEDDILYYLVDEDGNEVGFVIEEDGEEVECYYEGLDADQYEIVGEIEIDASSIDADEQGESSEEESDEVIELEISEDDISYYIFDEDGNEVGFVIQEDGLEIECYYDEDESDEDGTDSGSDEGAAPEAEPYIPEKAEDHGYIHKIASIAGFEGNKARKKAEVQLDKVRGKAEVQVDKAAKAASAQASKMKAKADENDLGITREGVKETTADLNAIAKEGAETAKELKEAYDDIMDSFGFLVPKKVRRKLP